MQASSRSYGNPVCRQPEPLDSVAFFSYSLLGVQFENLLATTVAAHIPLGGRVLLFQLS